MKKTFALFKLVSGGLLSILLVSPSHSCFANDGGLAGADTSQVMRDLGQPIKKLAAVGEPPISRWVYAQKTVYFERGLVLHIVEH